MSGSNPISETVVAGVVAAALSAIAGAQDLASLRSVRQATVGEQSEIAKLNGQLKTIDAEFKAAAGALIGKARAEIAAAFAVREEQFAAAEELSKLAAEKVDMTAVATRVPFGARHPLSLLQDQISDVFIGMGWEIAEGPELEHEWFNFDALNFDADHPARAMQDTFFVEPVDSHLVLRTHTSPVQIRAMTAQGAPIRVIAPGRVYRMDMDQTHAPMFHQVEGLAIDRNISMANLKWTLEEFCRAFFEVPSVELRFRASHFPFTEPSAEVDIRCSWEGGQLKIGQGDSWLEILGSGMVHPKVLTAAGVDPEKWQGFAFGMGIDRIAMLKYGIPDLRAFFESDLRWLRHYGFAALDMPDLPGGLSS